MSNKAFDCLLFEFSSIEKEDFWKLVNRLK
jgi:hypothetical protein